jgi:hypothetical protein
MTPTPSPDSETGATGLSEISRIIKVFTSPAEAFADIVRRPRWLAPLLLLMAAACLMIYLYSTHVGWERFIRQTIETNERIQQLPADQKETVLAQQRKFIPIFSYIGPLIFIPVGMAVVAGVLTLVFKVLHDAPLKFKQVFAITNYASLPGVISTLLAIGVMFIKDPDDFNLQNPTAFNAGAFLSTTAPKWQTALLGSFDLFSFWSIFLLATGMKVAAPKLSFGQCLMGIVIPWLLYVVVHTGWTSMFG